MITRDGVNQLVDSELGCPIVASGATIKRDPQAEVREAEAAEGARRGEIRVTPIVDAVNSKI